MSNDLNSCSFIGRAGKDPEMRSLPNGDQVANFSIACGWKSKDKDGTEWVRCTAFGKLAEIIDKYVTKGKQVFVSGRMQTRKWQKDGQDQYITEIVVERMQLLGGGEEREEAPKLSAPSKPASKQSSTSTGFDDMDDDIPF